MGYLQFILAGEHGCEVVTDLLRTPVLPQSFLNDSGELPVIELAGFGPARSDFTAFLCGIGPIAARCRVCVPAQLPTDRRRGTTQIPRDCPDNCTTQPQIRDAKTLERTVRVAATASVDEGEFVRRLRRGGVLIRARYAAGRDDVVAGYSVAVRPPTGEKPIWYGGGRLARDLTLPRLREGWPDSPQSAQGAVDEWRATAKNPWEYRPVAPGREESTPSPEMWKQYSDEIGQLRDVPVTDRATWAHVARETAGAFAAWSQRVEATPGPLAQTSRELARSAHLRAYQSRPKPVQLGSASNAAMILMQAASGGQGTMAEAIMLRQLGRVSVAILDMHSAVGDAGRAEQVTAMLRNPFAAVTDRLPMVPSKNAQPDHSHRQLTFRSSYDELPRDSRRREPVRRCRTSCIRPSEKPQLRHVSVTVWAETRRRKIMAEETDDVGETFDDSLRIALTIASQFGERIARLREQLARQRESGAIQEARELEARFEAERGAARASLAPVAQPEWWNQASPEDIAGVHETATAWRDFDDVARDAGDTIKHELQERYGIDVDAPGADPAAVAVALRDAERDRVDAATERQRAGEDLTASQLIFANADRHEREAQEAADRDWNNGNVDSADSADFNDANTRDEDRKQAAEVADQARVERGWGELDYDSSERRERFAASLEGKADQKTINARILADGENAKHPREAVMSQSGKAAKPRRSIRSSVQERDRGGLSR